MELQSEEIIKRLCESKSKKDLNDACMLIRGFGKDWQESLGKSLKEKIVKILQDKSYEIIFKGGDVPDRTILWAYGIFDVAKSDDRFLSYVDFCKPYIRDTSLSYYERLLFIDYASVAIMLGGKREEAVKFFLENIMFLTLNDYYIADLNDFILAFLYYYYIPIEWILEIQRKNLSNEVYFNLDNVSKRSIFLWSMHCFWNTRHYFNNLKWIDNYDVWLNILRELLKRGELDEAMYVEFYIYHIYGNSSQYAKMWEKYNNEVVKLVEPYFVEFVKTLPQCKKEISKNGKIKIALIKDRVVLNSPTKVDYSFCKALLESEQFSKDYEISVYSLAYIQKSDDDPKVMQDFNNIGVYALSPAYPLIKEHSYYVSHLQKALKIREAIINDGIDVIITEGTNDASDFLLASRCAPLQIFWSHGNGYYDIEGIDKRISHFSPESPYKIEQVYVPMDRERFYNPPIDEGLIIKEKAKYPIKRDTVVLGVIGRLVKVDSDEYLQTISRILKENKNAIFIAAGNGNEPIIREKVEALGVSDRFFMPGFVNPHVYGHIIDIFCNTFPLDQGESFSEFLAKKGAFLNLLNRKCTFSGELRELKFGKKALVYFDNLEEFKPNVCGFDEFVKTDCIFITNKNLKVHKDISDKILTLNISDDDIEKLFDYKLHVTGDTFEFVTSNFVCEKDLLWCIYNASNLKWWKEMADNIHEYYVDGKYIGWCCSAFSKDQYVEKAKFLIENKNIRDKLGEFYRKHRELQTNKFKQDLIKKFTHIIKG